MLLGALRADYYLIIMFKNVCMRCSCSLSSLLVPPSLLAIQSYVIFAYSCTHAKWIGIWSRNNLCTIYAGSFIYMCQEDKNSQQVLMLYITLNIFIILFINSCNFAFYLSNKIITNCAKFYLILCRHLIYNYCV